MGWIPEPRYQPSRRRWYLQLNGRRITLARDADFPNRKAAERAATKEYHRLMAEDAGRKAARPVLGVLFADWIAEVRGRACRGAVSARRADDIIDRIGPFVLEHADREAEDIDGPDLDAWVARHDWGPNRTNDFVTTLATLYRWGRRHRRVSCDPPSLSSRPARKLKRDKVPTAEEVDTILAAIQGPAFFDFARFVALTGARPSEVASAEARHLDGDALVLDRHKTASKGKDRAIMLNPPALAIVRRLVEARPEGPLFLNDRGRPWTRNGWGQAFQRAREAAGADPRVTLYSFRHARATTLLTLGEDLETVSKLLGHASTALTSRVYSDIAGRREHLRRAAGRGVEGGDG